MNYDPVGIFIIMFVFAFLAFIGWLGDRREQRTHEAALELNRIKPWETPKAGGDHG